MTTSDWINLIAAILVGGGTLFLGIMAWQAIRQTRSIQKAENRERLLNEIIDWAIDVTKGELLMEIADVAGIKDIRRARLYLYTTIDKLQFSFRQARTRGLYISGIVSILGADLQRSVGELVRNLEAHIQALKECMDTIDSPVCERTLSAAITVARKTTDPKKVLDESATRVLEEAVKIRVV